MSNWGEVTRSLPLTDLQVLQQITLCMEGQVLDFPPPYIILLLLRDRYFMQAISNFSMGQSRSLLLALVI